MRLHYPPGLSLLIALASVSPAMADSPLSTLKEKGLVRSGRYFVIDAEKPVLEKAKDIKTVMAIYNATASRKDEAEQYARESARMEERRGEIQDRLTQMNQRITEQGFQQNANSRNFPGGGGPQQQGGNFPQQGSNFPQQGGNINQLIAQRNMVQMELTEVTSALKSIKAEAARGKDAKGLEQDAKASLEEAKASLAELRSMVDEVSKRYEGLESDPSVKAAIADVGKDLKGTFKIGPSDAFKAVLKTLEQAERKVLAKRSTVVAKKATRSRR